MCLSKTSGRISSLGNLTTSIIMISLKSMGWGKAGTLVAMGVLAGLMFVYPRVREIGEKPPGAAGKVSIPSSPDRAEPGRMNVRNPDSDSASVQSSRSLTVDELVAIYESQGAAAAIAAAKSMTGPERASQVVFILKYLGL